jgi:hypothetical protein
VRGVMRKRLSRVLMRRFEEFGIFNCFVHLQMH